VLLQGHDGQERSPEPAPPGGTSTSSSAVQQEHSFIEPAGVPGCSHPGRVLLQGHDGQERSLRAGASPGGTYMVSSLIARRSASDYKSRLSVVYPASMCSTELRALMSSRCVSSLSS